MHQFVLYSCISLYLFIFLKIAIFKKLYDLFLFGIIFLVNLIIVWFLFYK